MTTENEYFTKLFRDTDKLLAALDALDKAHPSFSTVKYKLNREAGGIADLITSCRRSIQFLKDDPACKQRLQELDDYAELLKSYHHKVKVTGGLCSSDKYRIKRAELRQLIADISAARDRLKGNI